MLTPSQVDAVAAQHAKMMRLGEEAARLSLGSAKTVQDFDAAFESRGKFYDARRQFEIDAATNVPALVETIRELVKDRETLIKTVRELQGWKLAEKSP